MDLWFHGVALTGFEGLGPLPLYRPGYAGAVRRDRGALRPTRLEREGGRFLDAFRRDSSFEVVHFLPLYFVTTDRADMLEALRLVAAEGSVAVSRVPRTARFGAAAAASLFSTSEERSELAAFVAALGDEWATTYGSEWQRVAPGSGAVVSEAQRRWRQEYEPSLRPFLTRYRLDGGVIYVVASLGPEGRFFPGSPRERNDKIVAVGLPAGVDAEGILFESVRELCFPAVRRAVPLPESERASGERSSSHAAVRCGDLVMARYLPARRDAYRQFWLALTGAPGGVSLESAFPLTAPQLSALARAVAPGP